jgi:hypothetical protein
MYVRRVGGDAVQQAADKRLHRELNSLARRDTDAGAAIWSPRRRAASQVQLLLVFFEEEEEKKRVCLSL